MIKLLLSKLVTKFGIKDICISKRGLRKELSWEDFIILCLNSNTEDLISLSGFSPGSGFSKYFSREFPDISKDKGGKTWKTYLLGLIDYKFCSSCNTIKSRADFAKDSSSSTGFQTRCKNCNKTLREDSIEYYKLYRKKYYLLNKYTLSKNAKQYYLENIVDIKARQKEYYLNNKEQILSVKSKYREINKEKLRELQKGYNTKYYLTHKYIHLAKSAKRRATKLQATPNWANLIAIKEIYRTCPVGYHVDHIVPLQNDSVCGLHCEFNLQHLPAKENLSKGNRFEVC